jgi:phage terminase large subunit-like protein
MGAEKSRRARLRHLLRLTPAERSAHLAGLSGAEREELKKHWALWARPGQTPPEGDWTTWLICAGRGFGKTRCGAEWVRHVAKRDPDARIALVGSSIAEVRQVMVEGESGILSVCRSVRPAGCRCSNRPCAA